MPSPSVSLDPVPPFGRLKAEGATRASHLDALLEYLAIDLHDFHAAARKNWEQKRREPEAAAKALLMVAARNPKMVLEALHG